MQTTLFYNGNKITIRRANGVVGVDVADLIAAARASNSRQFSDHDLIFSLRKQVQIDPAVVSLDLMAFTQFAKSLQKTNAHFGNWIINVAIPTIMKWIKGGVPSVEPPPKNIVTNGHELSTIQFWLNTIRVYKNSSGSFVSCKDICDNLGQITSKFAISIIERNTIIIPNPEKPEEFVDVIDTSTLDAIAYLCIVYDSYKFGIWLWETVIPRLLVKHMIVLSSSTSGPKLTFASLGEQSGIACMPNLLRIWSIDSDFMLEFVACRVVCHCFHNNIIAKICDDDVYLASADYLIGLVDNQIARFREHLEHL